MKKKNIIKIKEETQIGDYVLEKGDKIKVLKEQLNRAVQDALNSFISEKIEDIATDIRTEWVDQFDEFLVGQGTDYDLGEDDVEEIITIMERMADRVESLA